MAAWMSVLNSLRDAAVILYLFIKHILLINTWSISDKIVPRWILEGHHELMVKRLNSINR